MGLIYYAQSFSLTATAMPQVLAPLADTRSETHRSMNDSEVLRSQLLGTVSAE